MARVLVRGTADNALAADRSGQYFRLMDAPGPESAANLAWWEEAAPLHAGSEFYDLVGLLSGNDAMRPHEVGEIGDVSGCDLVHLQCHLGTDTLSWARRGARVVGLDFSSKALEVARRLASDCGVDIEYVCSNVYDAPDSLEQRTFDIVYTGIGALNWLADLRTWADVVDQLLRPGGILYLAELHPMVFGVADDGRTLAHDMFQAGYRANVMPGGTYAVPQAEMQSTVTFESVHGIGDVVTAVLGVGLTVELLREQDYTNAPWPWTVRGEDGFFRLPDGFPNYPLAYSLRARKPGRPDDPVAHG
jgi:2-polyprenyl-3-methyl-5-hydroxy-6-metoxy-1,4-benzoquinol methylase